MSSLQREMLRSKLPPFPPGPTGPPSSRHGRKDYNPVKGNKYFSEEHEVRVDSGDIFKVYRCSSIDCPPDKPVLFLLHGAGYSGLTWACFAAEIVSMVECSVIALDLRGHGETVAGDETNLSTETMVQDIGDVYQKLFETSERQPPVILVGHSMGGALAVHVAAAGRISGIIGIVVIDVVEGTALDALQGMQAVLRARPKSFRDLNHAIEWCCRSGQTRNIEAAKVSMPAMLKRQSDGVPATKLIGLSKASPTTTAATDRKDGDTIDNSFAICKNTRTIPEDEEADFRESDQNTPCFTWRIDLSRTEPYWAGWFSGLSSSFLSQPCAKLLLLAGIDRLDRDLTIGQMQGKFQTQVLPKVGHAVHEDAPDKVAEAIASFLVRNKLCGKIGDFSSPSVCC